MSRSRSDIDEESKKASSVSESDCDIFGPNFKSKFDDVINELKKENLEVNENNIIGYIGEKIFATDKEFFKLSDLAAGRIDSYNLEIGQIRLSNGFVICVIPFMIEDLENNTFWWSFYGGGLTEGNKYYQKILSNLKEEIAKYQSIIPTINFKKIKVSEEADPKKDTVGIDIFYTAIDIVRYIFDAVCYLSLVWSDDRISNKPDRREYYMGVKIINNK